MPIVYTYNECHEKCWRSKLYDHCKKHLFEVNLNNLKTFLYNLIHNTLKQILIFCLNLH